MNRRQIVDNWGIIMRFLKYFVWFMFLLIPVLFVVQLCFRDCVPKKTFHMDAYYCIDEPHEESEEYGEDEILEAIMYEQMLDDPDRMGY